MPRNGPSMMNVGDISSFAFRRLLLMKVLMARLVNCTGAANDDSIRGVSTACLEVRSQTNTLFQHAFTVSLLPKRILLEARFN